MFLQHNASNNTDRIISLLQDQIEFLQEELKSKNKIVNSLIENLSRNDDVFFFWQKEATLKAPENQTNYKQLQNKKTIDSKESQNKNTPECFCIKEKESQSSDKLPEEIARSIVDLATSIKNEKHDVSISNIIIRAGDKKLEEKRCEVNSFLGKLCKEKNYYLIDHSTRIKRNQLNKRKVTFKS